MVVATSGLTDGVGYALGALCLVLLSVGVWRYSWERRATAREVTREQRARLRDLDRIRKSMEELLQRLEESARQIDAQAEQRINALQALMREVDERIAQLRVVPTANPPSGEVLASSVASRPASVTLPPHQPVSPPAPASRSALTETEAQDVLRRRQSICEWADAGTPRPRIAEMLGVPLGEVELVLNLREFAHQASPSQKDASRAEPVAAEPTGS